MQFMNYHGLYKKPNQFIHDIQFIKMNKLIIYLLQVALISACHYSCSTCSGQYYTSCITCTSGSQITVIQDPTTTPVQYWSSVYPTGTCVDTNSSKTNALGVILFIVLSVVCLVIRTKESFYLFFTIQTYGLYNLIEIAWVNPIGYILESAQFLMIWNILGSGYKKTDYVLVASKNYRINSYLKQTDIGQNLAIIAAFTLISFALLIVICIITVRRKKQPQQKKQEIFQNMLNMSEIQKDGSARQPTQQNKDQKCACWKWFSEQVLIQVAKFLLVILYLMIQQTSLVLLVTLVFQSASASIIVLCVIYLHILIFVMSYAYYYRVEYFKDKKVMYINFAKKIILPVMVVVPIRFQFLFFLFAAAIIVVEFIIDYLNELYSKFSRLGLYKGLEILTVVLLIIYYIVQTNAKSYSSARAASIACAFVTILYLAFFICIELPFGIKEKYFSNVAAEQVKVQQITMEDINNKNTMQVVEIESFKQSGDDNEEGEEYSDEQNYHQMNLQTDKKEQKEDKITKDQNNTSINQDTLPKPAEQPAPKPEPPKKKKRKQIIDKELRLRYGI